MSRRSSLRAEFAHLFGIVPNAEIARRAGVTRQAVTQWRGAPHRGSSSFNTRSALVLRLAQSRGGVTPVLIQAALGCSSATARRLIYDAVARGELREGEPLPIPRGRPRKVWHLIGRADG